MGCSGENREQKEKHEGENKFLDGNKSKDEWRGEMVQLINSNNRMS